MITESTMYWITRCDSIHNISVIIFAICIPLFVLELFKRIFPYPPPVNIKVSIPIVISLICVGTIINIFVPTTKETCAIIIIPKITNNENIQNISKEFYNFALDWMKELHQKRN